MCNSTGRYPIDSLNKQVRIQKISGSPARLCPLSKSVTDGPTDGPTNRLKMRSCFHFIVRSSQIILARPPVRLNTLDEFIIIFELYAVSDKATGPLGREGSLGRPEFRLLEFGPFLDKSALIP